MFDSASITAKGGRDVNQDAVLLAAEARRFCWAVADGLGGVGGGELASAAALEAVEQEFRAGGAIDACMAAANAAVRQRQSETPAFATMRTTLVVLLSDGETARWAHCGDSRLYRFGHAELKGQTLDHSVPQVLVNAGRIGAAEIRGHADRNRLLKSLGGGDGAEWTIAEPLDLEPGDAFLLASDGFWELVTEREMEAELAKAASARAWLDGMQARLIPRLLAADGADNFSAVAILRS